MKITYGKSIYYGEDGESVLDCLLRNEESVPHSCQAGVCQSCMLQLDDKSDGKSDEKSDQDALIFQQGLAAPLVEQGYFLPCQSYTRSSLNIIAGTSQASQCSLKVIEILYLPDSVCVLTLRALGDKPFPFRGGQFINIWKDPKSVRTYSIASADNSDHIELHIKLYPNGAFSQYVFHKLLIGDELQAQPARGLCYYDGQSEKKSLRLFAIGTGLAPMLGILRTALGKGHQHAIELVFSSRDAEDLYCLKELSELAVSHANLQVVCLAQNGELEKYDGIQFELADIYEFAVAKERFDANAMHFLCGPDSFVGKLKKKLFLAGADLASIRADAFLKAAEGR